MASGHVLSVGVVVVNVSQAREHGSEHLQTTIYEMALPNRPVGDLRYQFHST